MVEAFQSSLKVNTSPPDEVSMRRVLQGGASIVTHFRGRGFCKDENVIIDLSSSVWAERPLVDVEDIADQMTVAATRAGHSVQ